MAYRCWERDSFEDDHDGREANAWPVPDRHGILNPDVVTPCDDPSDAAEQFAADREASRYGWEMVWPFSVVVHDGDRYHLVQVERVFVPAFRADPPAPYEVKP